jgi:hypothetical protein
VAVKQPLVLVNNIKFVIKALNQILERLTCLKWRDAGWPLPKDLGVRPDFARLGGTLDVVKMEEVTDAVTTAIIEVLSSRK